MAKSPTPPEDLTPQPSIARLYQDCFQVYTQALAETAAYTARMTNIALQLTQIAVSNGMKAGNAAAEAAQSGAGHAHDAPPIPDIMTGAAQLQNIMMRNMSDWQQQILRGMPNMNGAAGPGGSHSARK